MRWSFVCATVLYLAAASSLAEEGMWTPDNFPTAAVKERYGVALTDSWLRRIQHSVTRHAGGCSGSFVSAHGLVLTNHHCIMRCLSALASSDRDLVRDGYQARDRSQELKCPSELISVLVDIENVTATVQEATAKVAEAQAGEVRRQTLQRLGSECTQAAQRNAAEGSYRCDPITMYQGGQYFLYKYKVYSDVRLVFAPHHAIAAFGGNQDNFEFPRSSLDFALLRMYVDDKPAQSPNHLKWRVTGPRAGELVFVAGHPITTNRQLTVEQLKFQRDTMIPSIITRNAELRGRLVQWGRSGPEPLRIIQESLQGTENALKVYTGLQRALLDDRLMSQKVAEELALRRGVMGDVALAEQTGHAWEEIASAAARYRQMFEHHTYLEGGVGFGGLLFAHARQIVRGAIEREKPEDERRREFLEFNLPRVRGALSATTPIYPEYERLTLSFSLEKLRESLPREDPFVRSLFGDESPETLADKLVSQTALADAEARIRLWEGGLAGLEKSTDPMIELARRVEEQATKLRNIFETEVDAPISAAQERLAAARFALFSTDRYPDATFTLRFSYGAVSGWVEKGAPIAPFTNLSRLYAHANGKAPFALPEPWMKAQSRLDPATPFSYTTTNDVVGGNSGSPVVDAKGSIVGLIFDGNRHSISGSYWYDEQQNRAIAVHPAIMTVALRDVYGMQHVVGELLETSGHE